MKPANIKREYIVVCTWSET